MPAWSWKKTKMSFVCVGFHTWLIKVNYLLSGEFWSRQCGNKVTLGMRALGQGSTERFKSRSEKSMESSVRDTPRLGCEPLGVRRVTYPSHWACPSSERERKMPVQGEPWASDPLEQINCRWQHCLPSYPASLTWFCLWNENPHSASVLPVDQRVI